MTTGRLNRARYHHGDLANALTCAATDLARRGGPEAVVLREAARQVGVSATAAYRHFAGHGELIHAVKESAQADLAARMEAELAAGTPESDPGLEALRRLRALGLGYIRFALAEPGLFRTAFCRSDATYEEQSAGMLASRSFQMLNETLDDLVKCGRLAPENRPYSEVAAWAGVHGLANLLLEGPLRSLPERERETAIQRSLDVQLGGMR